MLSRRQQTYAALFPRPTHPAPKLREPKCLDCGGPVECDAFWYQEICNDCWRPRPPRYDEVPSPLDSE